jgi:hypothetical protein
MEVNIRAFQAPNQMSEVSHMCFLVSDRKIKRQTLTLQKFYILGYKTAYSVESQPTFRRNGESTWQEGLCFHPGFLPFLFFDAENGGGMFLRNVGWLSTDYKALYPR